MKRFFNIAGPCIPDKHYMLSPSECCGDLMTLIDQELYFAIHAARQTGKTTLLISLAKQLEATEQYYALYVSLESCQGVTDYEKGIPAVVAAIRTCLNYSEPFRSLATWELPQETAPTAMLRSYLSDIYRALDKPLIVLFDEVDCLANGTDLHLFSM